MDANELIEKAKEKQVKKAEKQGVTRQGSGQTTITNSAHKNVKKIADPKYKDLDKKNIEYSEAAKNAPPDSITARANMVARFDEKNSRKGNKKK